MKPMACFEAIPEFWISLLETGQQNLSQHQYCLSIQCSVASKVSFKHFKQLWPVSLIARAGRHGKRIQLIILLKG